MNKTVSSLAPAPYNPRNITDAQMAALRKALEHFGDMGGIVFNVRTGHLVGGHQRVKHLSPSWKISKRPEKDKTGTVARGDIETPWGRFDYREVDWPEAKEKAANLAANKHGGTFNLDGVKSILEYLGQAAFDLDLTGFLVDERYTMLGGGPEGKAGADEAPPAPRVAKSKTGDLYLLGEHRLLCGDATKEADVTRLLAGRQAALVWTDPPYGVSYVGKTKEALKIQNDGSKDLGALLTAAFAQYDRAMAPGAPIYVAHPAGALSAVFAACFIAQGWRLHETLVWVKDSMVLGHSDYHYKHEPILFGYKKLQGGGRSGRGGKGWYGPNNAVSVFEVARPKASEQHPTMKPVELITPMLMNSSQQGDVVVDLFGGSGSTLIACEQAKRRAHVMELSPVYVDVQVERWQNFTGKKAILEK